MSENRQTVTFFAKTETTCPVCGEKFNKEEMMTGSGRLNAGELTEELRRLYIPSKKYGEVNPLIYYIVVCPACLFASSPGDFTEIKEQHAKLLKSKAEERLISLGEVFPQVDFKSPRTLIEGVCSYYLALNALEVFPRDMSPSIKGGIYSLRAAWICNDLHAKYPDENYDYLATVFYRKARFYYIKAIQGEQDGSEGIGGARTLGPDLDKNYGYDGVLYMGAYLQHKFAPKDDEVKRNASLADAKRIVARIFGMGKASKNKPAAILDNAKSLYEKIKVELKETDD